MSLESLFQEAPDIVIGKITDVGVQSGDYGPQVVIELTPLGGQLPRTIYFAAKATRQSKWRRWISSKNQGWPSVGVTPTKKEDLLGIIAKFKLEDSEYTIPNRDTGEDEIRTSTFWRPMAVFTDESSAMKDPDYKEAGDEIPFDDVDDSSAAAEPADFPSAALLEKATQLWDALDKDVFRNLAVESWPEVTEENIDALIAALPEKPEEE